MNWSLGRDLSLPISLIDVVCIIHDGALLRGRRVRLFGLIIRKVVIRHQLSKVVPIKLLGRIRRRK
jgi:hypothetical protein